MKIYRLWTDSLHHLEYTLRYFESKEDALENIPEMTTSGPEAGVEEIEVVPASQPTAALDEVPQVS